MGQLINQSVTISTPTNDNQWWLIQSSHLTLAQGGAITGYGAANISVMQTSTLTISGGDTGLCQGTVGQQSTMTVSSGTVQGQWAIVQGSTATISGGTISGSWTIAQGSTVIIQGSGLTMQSAGFSQQRVTGTLKDGTPFDLTFFLAENQNPHLILQNS